MHIFSYLFVYSVIGWFIRAAMVPVVLRRQFAPGASLAWLGIVFLHPYIGFALYMLVGETRLGPHRVEQYRQIIARSRVGSAGVAQGELPGQMRAEYEPMVKQALKISGMPVLPGNGVEFFVATDVFVQRLVSDIDAAGTCVDLLYYIFAGDETARQVANALQRAKSRGVKCRVLVDAVASRGFLHGGGLAHVLRADGIEVAAALRPELIRRRLPRVDLRNHRKLAVIDGRIGYVGSHNLINADYGGRHGGPWVDATGRFSGPIVDELSIVFNEDWAFEKGIPFSGPERYDETRTGGDVLMQVAPTGPSAPGDTYRRLLLAAVQCARTQLTLTTPYFVPDETTLVALLMAADRGVQVRLLVPQAGDHFFTAAAGRAHYARLMEAGVGIYLYRPGLIHAKTTTVDNAFCLFGSANLDVRSFNLNFELSMLLYGKEVTRQLLDVQEKFLSDCVALDPQQWAKRSAVARYGDGAVSLLSPLL